MTDVTLPLHFRFEPGELKWRELLDAVHRVLLALPDLGALWAVASPGFWLSTAKEIAGMIRDVASVQLGEVLVGGWNQHARFAKYADPARFPPEKVSRVPLASHHIKSTYEPYIELLVDGQRSGTIPLEMVVDLSLEGVIVLIQNGRFMRVEAGQGRLTGTLKCAGVTVCERATRDYAWSAGIGLGREGVQISKVV